MNIKYKLLPCIEELKVYRQKELQTDRHKDRQTDIVNCRGASLLKITEVGGGAQ